MKKKLKNTTPIAEKIDPAVFDGHFNGLLTLDIELYKTMIKREIEASSFFLSWDKLMELDMKIEEINIEIALRRHDLICFTGLIICLNKPDPGFHYERP